MKKEAIPKLLVLIGLLLFSVLTIDNARIAGAKTVSNIQPILYSIVNSS